MKNFGLLILGIILGALAMYFYCCHDTTGMDSDDPIVKPKGLISPKEAMALDEAFNLKHRIINDSLFKKSTDGGDNRSSWWNLEDIESYIAYAKNQAKENGNVMDGLRIYLGSYPDEDSVTGLTTMFFIPTGYEGNSDGSMLPFFQGSGDLDDSDGLNLGQSGYPPGANYPQD